MSELLKCCVCNGLVSSGARKCPHCGELDFIQQTAYRGPKQGDRQAATIVSVSRNTPYRGFMVETESGIECELEFREDDSRKMRILREFCEQVVCKLRLPGPHLKVILRAPYNDRPTFSLYFFTSDTEVLPQHDDLLKMIAEKIA
jgi:hypothetical protein